MEYLVLPHDPRLRRNFVSMHPSAERTRPSPHQALLEWPCPAELSADQMHLRAVTVRRLAKCPHAAATAIRLVR